MLRSSGKQCGESVESVLEKKRNATVGKMYRFSTLLKRLDRSRWLLGQEGVQ